MYEVDKIYRRSTQSKGKRKSRSKKNEKNRVRNVIMNFRVSPTEKELIETRIKLTGMLKSKFFIQSCLYQTILVKGNIKTFTEIKKQIDDHTGSSICLSLFDLPEAVHRRYCNIRW